MQTVGIGGLTAHISMNNLLMNRHIHYCDTRCKERRFGSVNSICLSIILCVTNMLVLLIVY